MTLDEQIKCVGREIGLRKAVYPRFVTSGKISQPKADHELQAMSAVYETLKQLRDGHRAPPVGGRELRLEAGLKVTRAMIRGEMLEHAVVDLKEPDTGLGAFIDRLLATETQRVAINPATSWPFRGASK